MRAIKNICGRLAKKRQIRLASLFTFTRRKRFKDERGQEMKKETGFQFNNEQFSLLVKRARQQALLKSILISAGTSLVFHCLIRRDFLKEKNTGKVGK